MDRKLALTILFAGVDKVSGTMRQIVGLGERGGQVLGRMKREARDLEAQLRNVRDEITGSTGNVTALIARERELERAIAGVNRQAERQRRIMAIDAKVGRIQAQGESYKSAGQQNMIGGASMAAPLVVVTKGAMDFSSGMVDLQQKAELSNRELVVMQGNILAAAKATHQLPEDMRAAVDALAGFGMDARQAVRLAEPIGRLGSAFKVDLADGAGAAFATMNNLKVPLDQIGRSFDIMAEGGKQGAFEIQDMARHFPSLTAQLQALGQTGTPAVADLTAALQVAMNTAGSADEAANNIANLMGKINSPTVINAFAKKFGVDLPAAMKKAQAQGKTTMEAFAEIAGQATGGDMTRLGWVVEDRQAQMGLMALMQNMEKYRAIRASITGAQGTVQAAFSQREMNDASVQWAAFMSTAQSTSLVLGAKLLPAATQLLGVVGNVVGAIGDWAQANPQLASGLMTAVGALALARVGLGALQFAFGSILGPMATAWGWWAKYRELGSVAAAFPTLAKGFGMVRTAALFMAQGVMRAGMLMLANPVVLAIVAIVTAIGVAGYLIYRHWDTIKAAFQTGLAYLGQAWTWLKAKGAELLPILTLPLRLAGALVMAHWNAMRGAFAWGVSMLGQAWTGIKGAFNAGIAFLFALPAQMLTVGAQIIQGLARGITSAPGAVWNALKSIVMSGIANIKAFLGIKSPSRLFMGIGGFMTEGLAVGVERGSRRPVDAVSGLAAGVAAAMTIAPAGAAQPALPGGGTAAGSALGAASGGGASFTINIQQLPGEDGEALARRVMELIERKQGNARRGGYYDG